MKVLVTVQCVMTCDDNTVYMYIYGPHLSLPLSPLAWQQHDVQELCRVMFDALERQFQKDKYERPDLINELYQGTMKDYVKCLKVRRRPTLGEGEGEGGREGGGRERVGEGEGEGGREGGERERVGEGEGGREGGGRERVGEGEGGRGEGEGGREGGGRERVGEGEGGRGEGEGGRGRGRGWEGGGKEGRGRGWEREGRRRKGRGREDKGEMPVQWILHCYLQCGYESAREDHFLDIPLVIKPFGSTTTHGSVVSGGVVEGRDGGGERV